MSPTLARQALTALSECSSHTRLYELKLERDDPGLLVAAFVADEQLPGIGARRHCAVDPRGDSPFAI